MTEDIPSGPCFLAVSQVILKVLPWDSAEADGGSQVFLALSGSRLNHSTSSWEGGSCCKRERAA